MTKNAGSLFMGCQSDTSVLAWALSLAAFCPLPLNKNSEGECEYEYEYVSMNRLCGTW